MSDQLLTIDNLSFHLLDEPRASLDPLAAWGALEVIRSQARRGRGVLLVEHRVDDALSIEPDQALLLHEGRQCFLGPGLVLPTVADPLLVKLPAPAALTRMQSSPPPAPPPPYRANPTAEVLIELDGVEFGYDDGPPVLKGVSLTVRKGDVIALLGPNGSGKTTLVKHLLSLNRPRAGREPSTPSSSLPTTLTVLASVVILVNYNFELESRFNMESSIVGPLW